MVLCGVGNCMGGCDMDVCGVGNYRLVLCGSVWSR
jgi:hypothetical protein